jgi:glucose-6-phosphate isomerase
MSDIRIDTSRAMASAVGKEHGITPEELRDIQPRIAEGHEALLEQRRSATRGFYDLYKDTATLERVKDAAKQALALNPENLVVLGIGGSSLGTLALASALKSQYHNLMSRASRKGAPRLFVMDNIDPVTFRDMMRICPPQKSVYNVISKSGSTAETVGQMMIVTEALEKKLGAQGMKDRFFVTTSPRTEGKENPLQAFARLYDLTTFDVPNNVGGRFSVFTPVGMFPAAVLGMDVDALFAGCAQMDARCATPDLDTNPAYRRAAFQYLADTRKGKVMSVMLSYSDGLYRVADWYRQLWAESLGKRLNTQGEEVFAGQTPIKALGATDQHSQIQLYREGPNDKLINVLEVQRFDKTLKYPDVLGDIPALGYLRGATMNKLMAAELKGTIDALKISKRPVIRISLPKIDSESVAQLLYMLEVETAMAGQLYGVDAFDQPGVEEGKNIARKLMGGQG